MAGRRSSRSGRSGSSDRERRASPPGTVSLGWGPLLPEATLTIPVGVVRRADGPVAFDLQILSDNAILTLAGRRAGRGPRGRALMPAILPPWTEADPDPPRTPDRGHRP